MLLPTTTTTNTAIAAAVAARAAHRYMACSWRNDMNAVSTFRAHKRPRPKESRLS